MSSFIWIWWFRMLLKLWVFPAYGFSSLLLQALLLLLWQCSSLICHARFEYQKLDLFFKSSQNIVDKVLLRTELEECIVPVVCFACVSFIVSHCRHMTRAPSWRHEKKRLIRDDYLTLETSYAEWNEHVSHVWLSVDWTLSLEKDLKRDCPVTFLVRWIQAHIRYV